MAAVPTRIDRGVVPGSTAEGAIADGETSATVIISLHGTPAQVLADYQTLFGTSLTANSTIHWRKR